VVDARSRGQREHHTDFRVHVNWLAIECGGLIAPLPDSFDSCWRKNGVTFCNTLNHDGIFALGLILNEMFTGHVPQGSGYTQIKSVAPEFGYLDELVDSMIRQKATERPPTIRRVKEELIARGNRFFEFQRLEVLKKQVVPESEINDPIIGDPIRPVEAESYSNGVLTIRLNREMNPKWEACFRVRATAFSGNFSSAMITFRRDRAFLRVNDHFVPHAVQYFEQYCPSANEEYATQVRREHQKAIEDNRNRLRLEVAQREHEERILRGIQFRP